MTRYDSDLTYDSILTYSGDAPAVAHSWIEIAGFAFTGAADDDGVEWWAEELEGWDAPDVRSGSTPRPGADGLFLPTFRHGGRSLELKAGAQAPDVATAFAAKDRLMAAFNLRQYLHLFVNEDRPRFVTVTRSGKILLKQVDAFLEFSVPLLAPDPRKYAADEADLDGSVGEELTFTNAGTVAATPTVTIRGPVAVPSLVDVASGDTLTFDVTIAEGDELVVDFDLHSALSGGVSYRSTLQAGYRWWDLPPGDTVIRVDADTWGIASGVTVSARSAWI